MATVLLLYTCLQYQQNMTFISGIISLAYLFWNIYERQSNKVVAYIEERKTKKNKSHKSIFLKLSMTQSQLLSDSSLHYLNNRIIVWKHKLGYLETHRLMYTMACVNCLCVLLFKYCLKSLFNGKAIATNWTHNNDLPERVKVHPKMKITSPWSQALPSFLMGVNEYIFINPSKRNHPW